jgi:hypothetical protein
LKDGAVLTVNAGRSTLRRDDARITSRRHSHPVGADVTAQAVGADQVWNGSDDVGRSPAAASLSR